MSNPIESLVAESWDYCDLLNSSYLEENWYIDQLIPKNGKVLIEAPRESFKSTLTQQMAICLATGTDFVGFRVDKPYKVVYLQCEGDLGDSAKRGRDFHLWLAKPERGMLAWDFLLRRKINTKAGLQSLVDICEQHGLEDGVLFIDPAYKTIRGSMKEDEPINDWTDNVDFAMHQFHSAVVVTHHEVKPTLDATGKPTRTGPGERLYGSAVWEYWASYGFQLKRLPGRAKRVTMVCWKARRPISLNDNPLELTLMEPRPFGVERAEEGVTSTMATIRALLRVEGGGRTKEELRERLGLVTVSATQKAVEVLIEMGWLEEGDERPRKYRFKQRG